MNKTKIILIVVAVLIIGFSIFSSINPVDIKDIVYSPPKNIVANENYVSVEGTWLPQNSRENNFFRDKEVNTSSIHCDKQLQTCNEARAIITQLESGSLQYGFYTHNFDYEVKEWTDSYLRAEHVGAGRVFDLTINFQNKTAVL